MFYLSHQCQMCVICFQYFGQHIEIIWKKVYFINFFYLLRIDTDPVRPHPDQHALDADSDPKPSRQNYADPTRSGSTTPKFENGPLF
jgi:hypothetical protein